MLFIRILLLWLLLSIGNVICSDETEAPSYEECKSLIVCSYDEVNCDDVIKQRLVLMKK